jgi:hypothetical protein
MPACKYHLEFSAKFRTAMIPEVMVLTHQDAPNHLMRGYTGMDKATIRDHIGSDIMAYRTILDQHREALSRWAPKKLRGFERLLIMSHIKAGNRLVALELALRHAGENPGSLYALSLVPLSLGGGSGLAAAKKVQGASEACVKRLKRLPWRWTMKRDRAAP